MVLLQYPAARRFAAARLFLVRSRQNLTFSCPLPTPVPNRSRETIMAGAQNETSLTLTADIVAAHVSNNHVAVSDLATTIERAHGALDGLRSAPAEAAPELKPACSVRATVQPRPNCCSEAGNR